MLRLNCALLASLLTLSLTAHGAPLAPVIVIAGGYNSCSDDGEGGVSPFGGNFNSRGVEYINSLQAHYSANNWQGMADRGIRWLFTCFNSHSDLFLQTSSDDRVTNTGAWSIHQIVGRIETLSDRYQRPIFIVGHSHGGWLAMRVVEALRSPIQLGFLATIDPISFPECNASTYADAANALITGWWPYDISACQQAPGDISSRELTRIRRNLNGNSWKHYWQQHFPPLHSGHIVGGPDSSLDFSSFFSLRYGGVASSWNAHSRISHVASIWFGLEEAFKHAF